MEEYIECCIVCSSWYIIHYPKIQYCGDCNRGLKNGEFLKKDKALTREDIIYVSKSPQSHYQNLSTEKYGTPDRWHEIFVETELSQQPLFSEEKYRQYLKKQAERDVRKKDIEEHPEKYEPKSVPVNTPKCPTCGSTDIKKISGIKRAAHIWAFGLFSKTSYSQFECENCGYKW